MPTDEKTKLQNALFDVQCGKYTPDNQSSTRYENFTREGGEETLH